MSGSVLVLNAHQEPLHRVSVRHAIRMVIRGVADVVTVDGDDKIGYFPTPTVLRLKRPVEVDWRDNAPKWSKRRLFVRDRNLCAYCEAEGVTIDHVHPVSRGGTSTWENTVAACFKCNNFKDNRTPEEAGMELIRPPFIPTWEQITT